MKRFAAFTLLILVLIAPVLALTNPGDTNLLDITPVSALSNLEQGKTDVKIAYFVNLNKDSDAFKIL